VATKGGHETFREDLVFEPGQAEKSFEIELRPAQVADVSPAPHAQPRPPVERPSAPETAGQATLNINSIPASNILLDGRPIGMTPKRGVTVSAGPHTVVFIHADQRATKSVKSVAGQSATVVHRFK
jgi:serine/threonine-protein kinase